MRVKHREMHIFFAAACIAGVLLTAPSLSAQTVAPLSLSQARQIAETRKALFTLIGAYFKPLGAILKGEKPYNPDETAKRIDRIVFLAKLLEETFPEGSHVGQPDSKAKAEIWSNFEDFTGKLNEFQASVIRLQRTDQSEKSESAVFKKALAVVAQNCKSCHDDYKEK